MVSASACLTAYRCSLSGPRCHCAFDRTGCRASGQGSLHSDERQLAECPPAPQTFPAVRMSFSMRCDGTSVELQSPLVYRFCLPKRDGVSLIGRGSGERLELTLAHSYSLLRRM